MNTKASKTLAVVIQNAMRIREASYDKKAADAATKKADAHRAADPSNMYKGHVDYKEFYGKTMQQAAEEAAEQEGDPALGDIVYHLMFTSWNDAADWAKVHA